ncbi:MAG TPA: FAD-dependent thymidylate synthase [Gaiellaceae bacterium]|nr:FAD-dependent thymidylate synthase [Gaiellaceae bacterium]
MAVTPEVIAQGSVPVLDHGFVRLDDAMADDLSVVNGARVSFARHKAEMDDSDAGLIRFLMRERHGCFDDRTEVLTELGWKPWPEVHGRELFATRSIGGRLEYQPALRLVRKEFRGHMLGFKGASIDLLVTPDHRVLASSMTTHEGRTNPSFRLQPAHRVLWKAHRHTATARWDGDGIDVFEFDRLRVPAVPFLRLLGFFIGDGNLPPDSNHLLFNLRKPREIAFLERTTAEAGLELKRWKARHAVPVTDRMRSLFEACYLSREKVIPRKLLHLSPPLLQALWEGLRESDGTVQTRAGADREVFYTTSRELADAVQVLAMKLGRSASVRPHRRRPGDGHFGRKPRWRVTMYAARNSRPALCRTREAASSQMGVEQYDGVIHCVEVPNGTLYVRRNGYPIWSGNTPFEHNSFRFHIRAPIFVAREWFRHRIGSFNEFSMRYAKATDDFYVPEPEDVRSQVGKPGAYSFEPVSAEVAQTARQELQAVYDAAYSAYERLVELGVARELARSVLPVGAYTEFYWTVNARALMNFLSLRNSETAQREIRRYAQACEQFLAEKMPVTYAAFVANDRTAP